MTNINNLTTHIETITARLLELMGISATRIVCQAKQVTDSHGQMRASLRVGIETADSARLMIGTRGSHLAALEHLMRCIASRQITPAPYLTVDINNYIALRERAMLNLAEQAARKAGRTRHAVVLPPMNAAQRHTVHASLAARSDVKTESLGQEPNRRIIIRPVF